MHFFKLLELQSHPIHFPPQFIFFSCVNILITVTMKNAVQDADATFSG
jgi:hypothetical protein